MTNGAIKIAKWFMNNNHSVLDKNFDAHAKLHKLLYYSQAMYFSVYGSPLFEEKIEAWENGPVVPKVFNERKKGILHDTFKEEPGLSDNVEKVLRVVNSVYGSLTTDELIELSHEELPWKEHEDEAKKRLNPEITKDRIEDYYMELKSIYEAYEEYDFESEAVETINGNNFVYDKSEIELSFEDIMELSQIGKTVDNKTFTVYKDEETGKLVIY